MDRKEILTRAQAQAGKTDEGQRYFQNRASAIGAVAFTLSAIALMLVSGLHGRKITEILILYWVYLSTTCFVNFYYTRRKVQCVTGIFSLLMLVYYLSMYVRSVFL